VQEQIAKIEYCNECNTAQPKIMLSIADSIIYAVYKNNKTQKRVMMNANDILQIFIDTTADDLKYLGIDGKNSHPKDLILTHLPVISPRSRPFVITDNMICDDDLTIQYIEIIKVNNHLADKTLSEPKRQKYISTLNFRIKCLMDNSHGKSRHTNNRPMRGIRERVAGKSGIIRSHLMGKRVNQSSRTVIGPDVHIPIGWMSIPLEVANTLTVPEKVTEFNIKYLTDLVHAGKANSIARGNDRIILKYALFKQGTKLLPNDIIMRTNDKGRTYKLYVKYDTNKYLLEPGDKLIRNGVEKTDVQYNEKNVIVLKQGDVIDRFIQDGDVLYLNRQPTLHTGSMIAQRVKITNGRTFRFPLACTKTYNADSTGSE
jgi:DNA-directed RNA polymerase beta' subunit